MPLGRLLVRFRAAENTLCLSVPSLPRSRQNYFPLGKPGFINTIQMSSHKVEMGPFSLAGVALKQSIRQLNLTIFCFRNYHDHVAYP